MSIASLITSIKTLRDQLVAKCIGLGILSNESYNLSDAVGAIENLDTAMQQKSVVFGSSAPETVEPDNGYSGLSKVNLSVGSGITGNKIVEGYKILGVEGTAVTVVNVKSLKHNTGNVSNVKSITINSSDMISYPSGSFTPGSYMPVPKELMVYRVVRPDNLNYNYIEVSFLLKAIDYNDNYGFGINLSGLSYLQNAFEYEFNSNHTTLTISVADSSWRFNGTYAVYYMY